MSGTSKVFTIFSVLNTISTPTAGLIGGIAVDRWGGPLAMGLAIWTGATTEPIDPIAAGFPGFSWGLWVIFSALCALTLPLVSRYPKVRGRLLAVQTITGLAAALLPFFDLWRLLGAAQGSPG
jgi:hypothetical protein